MSRRKLLGGALAGALLLGLGRPATSRAADGAVALVRLTGRVADARTGAPIPGAELRLEPGGARARADRVGIFHLYALAGTYAVVVGADGYAPRRYERVQLRQAVVRTLLAQLAPASEPQTPAPAVAIAAALPLPIPMATAAPTLVLTATPTPEPTGTAEATSTAVDLAPEPVIPTVQGAGAFDIQAQRLPATIRVRTNSGEMSMPLEEYLRGVVPSEMPASWPLEALKAQAVAARTYALRYYVSLGYICATQACQVWRPQSNPATDRAIAETRGQVITHGGEAIWALYSSACGGHTATGNAPYLVPVRCSAERTALDLSTDDAARAFWAATPGAFCSSSGNYRWQHTWTRQGLEAQLDRYLLETTRQSADSIAPAYGAGQLGTLVSVAARPGDGRGASGKVRILRVTGVKDGVTRSWDVDHEVRIRSVLRSGIDAPDWQKSANVVFEVPMAGTTSAAAALLAAAPAPADSRAPATTGTATYRVILPFIGNARAQISSVTIRGGGWGHANGLCQWGARGMALAGYRHDQIVTHYYSGVSIAVYESEA